MKISDVILLGCVSLLMACGGANTTENRNNEQAGEYTHSQESETTDTLADQRNDQQEASDDELNMQEALDEYYQQEAGKGEYPRKEHTAMSALDYHGEYLGTLPCTDCEGIRTTIMLNHDNTFSMHRQYLGKQEQEKVIEGTYSWEEGGNIIRLNELEKPNQYRVTEGALIQLDTAGNRITGDHASKYVLEKQY